MAFIGSAAYAAHPFPVSSTSFNSPSGSTVQAQSPSAASSDPDSPKIHKLRKAASEFEALLLSNWWRTMKESGWSDDGDDSDPAKDTLDQLGIQSVSEAVANGGGFGIATMLVHGLLARLQVQAGEAAATTANAATPLK